MHVSRPSRLSGRLGDAGFSLPELLTAASLFVSTLALVASFHHFEIQTLRDQAIQQTVQSSAQTLVDVFSREVRRACGISTAASDRIRFQVDLNGDGQIAGDDEDVAYVYDVAGHAVYRVSQLDEEVVVSDLDLSGSRLRYFAADNKELVPDPELDPASRAAIRRVRIELALAHDSTASGNKAKLRAEVSSDAELRSRFFMNEISNSNCIPQGENPSGGA
jgi:hypothetical protein